MLNWLHYLKENHVTFFRNLSQIKECVISSYSNLLSRTTHWIGGLPGFRIGPTSVYSPCYSLGQNAPHTQCHFDTENTVIHCWLNHLGVCSVPFVLLNHSYLI